MLTLLFHFLTLQRDNQEQLKLDNYSVYYVACGNRPVSSVGEARVSQVVDRM